MEIELNPIPDSSLFVPAISLSLSSSTPPHAPFLWHTHNYFAETINNI